MSTLPKIEWRGVTKRFSDRAVLHELHLQVLPGRSLVVIGGSGQGKSVMLKTALGLITPDQGRVLIDGEDVARIAGRTAERRFSRLGMLFQGSALFDSLSVWENVAFRLINADGIGRPEAKRRAMDALGKVRLGTQTANRYPAELSGGMQKRVALARAIVAEPEIMFFDEPTTGLDPITANAINHLINEQVQGLGCTSVTITHDLASARVIADEIALLHGGKVQWQGAVTDLDRSEDPYVEQFVSGLISGPIAADI